jgi:3-dehydrosphinganine reductase
MADYWNWWLVIAILVGALALVPTIMGFFGGNKFDVKGKVGLHTIEHLGRC